MKKILFFLFTLSIGVLIPNIAIADDIVGEDCVHWSSPTGGTLPLLAQELLNNGRTYTAPVSLCNSNNWTFSFSQAPAGNLSTFYSTSTNKATVIWRTPGVYIIKASINCGLWTDVFYKTVQVVNGNTGFSGVALSNLNDCPGQYTSFTLTNYSQNDNPIACYRVQITEVDNNNTPTGNYSWQNTNVYGNYNKVPINMSATANGFSLLPNKRYRVSLIVGVPYCVPGGEQTSSTYFQIGAGAFPITGSFSADSYGNTDGSTISTRIRSCSEKALNFLNTTNSSCGINAMELKIEQFSDISYTTPAPTPNNWGNTGGVYPSYNLRAMFPVLNSKGFYRLKATSYTNWGSQIKYFYIQTIDLADDDARFTFEVSTQIRNAAGYTSTTVNPFAAGVTLPVRLGPTSTNVSFTNFSNEYIDNFKVDIWQRDTRSALNPNLSIYTKNFCNPNPSNTSCPSTNSINFGNELMGLPGTTPLQGYFATGITLLDLPFQVFTIRVTATNRCGKQAIRETTFNIIRPSNCVFCRTANPDLSSDRGDEIDDALRVEVSPNPLQATAQFKFSLPQNDDDVSLMVTDISGRIVQTIFANQTYESGQHTSEWTIPASLTSGVYLYTLRTSKGLKTGKILKQ